MNRKKNELYGSIIQPVSNIKQKVITNSEMSDIIKILLLNINDSIMNAVKNRQQHVYQSIPLHFNIPNMTNSKAQLLIYTELINILEENGYHVRINKETNVWMISGWEIKCDDEIKKDLLELLASRTINK